MKKFNIDSADLLFWSMVSLIVMAVVFGADEVIVRKIY